MITFITGFPGKTLIALGIAHQLRNQGNNPFVFHESAKPSQIRNKAKKHGDVIVVWPQNISAAASVLPHIHIKIEKHLR